MGSVRLLSPHSYSESPAQRNEGAESFFCGLAHATDTSTSLLLPKALEGSERLGKFLKGCRRIQKALRDSQETLRRLSGDCQRLGAPLLGRMPLPPGRRPQEPMTRPKRLRPGSLEDPGEQTPLELSAPGWLPTKTLVFAPRGASRRDGIVFGI